MRVIFLRDVPGVGRASDARDVADGYARNFLLPRRLAVPATEATEKRFAAERERRAESRAVQDELLAQNIRALDGARVPIEARANKKGQLFAGIGKGEIVAAIEKEFRFLISADAIELEKPIKKVGEPTLTARCGGDVSHFTLIVKSIE